MDVFEFFKKRNREINIALKGGMYEEHDLKYDYGTSIVIMLVSRNSGKSVSAILLVEHDMDAVFALADRISVLVSGEIIATGEPSPK